ncbi:MAG: FAD-binding oxidoreductase [Acidobacteriota bacterium]|nr:FAD-binding oxidoreductase [Acidobacteriota bacterium]
MTDASREPDVLIVGAGVMGLSLAWALLKRRRRVLCIDRSSPGREASAATAGTLAVQNKPLASIQLTLASLRLWQGFRQELGRDVEFEVRGGVRVAHTPEDVEKLERSAAAQAAAGAPVEMLDRTVLFSTAPYLSRNIQAASFCALDAMVNPFLAVRALFVACRSAGAAFELNCPAPRLAIGGDGSVRVQSGDRTFAAPSVVIAAGAWICELAAQVGTGLPITTKVQQVLITDSGAARLPHVVTHVRGNLTLKQQAVTGKVLVGGGWSGVGDEVSAVRRLTRDSIVGNARAAIETVPFLAKARLLRAWTGFEGRTPDKLPVIGALAGQPSVHVLGCASGGLTLSPAAGELLAQILCDELPSLPVEPFAPSRFASGSPVD